MGMPKSKPNGNQLRRWLLGQDQRAVGFLRCETIGRDSQPVWLEDARTYGFLHPATRDHKTSRTKEK